MEAEQAVKKRLEYDCVIKLVISIKSMALKINC